MKKNNAINNKKTTGTKTSRYLTLEILTRKEKMSFAVANLSDGRTMMSDGTIVNGTLPVSKNVVGNIGNSRTRESELARLAGAYNTPGTDPYTSHVTSATKSATDSPAPSGGANLKDPYANPGPGYFWDAADGWKRSGGDDAEARRREEETRNAISSGYDQYASGLRGLESTYESGRDEEIGSASKIYEQIFGGLEDQRSSNLAGLEAGRNQVRSREESSIKGLQQNLLNTQRGMTMQLGAMGAGDTSATQVMMPYAYNKIAGQQEGSIRGQSNQQLFEIDQQERDTELQFAQMQRQTEVEKEQSLQGIRQYYGDAIQRVKTALVQAPLEKQRDLANLSQSLLAEAQANLRNLEGEYRQRQNSIRDWAVNRMSELNNARLQMAGSANFSPRDITYQELQMLNAPQATGVGVGQEFWNPMSQAKKIREDYLNS